MVGCSGSGKLEKINLAADSPKVGYFSSDDVKCAWRCVVEGFPVGAGHGDHGKFRINGTNQQPTKSYLYFGHDDFGLAPCQSHRPRGKELQVSRQTAILPQRKTPLIGAIGPRHTFI